MSLTSIISQGVTGLVKPITELIARKQERKAAKEAVRGKIAVATQEDEHELVLTDGEWETIAAQMQAGSYKDELVTIVITAPFWLLLLGGIAGACGFPQVFEGTVAGIHAIVAAGVDMAFLMNAVVLAAIGLKVWRV